MLTRILPDFVLICIIVPYFGLQRRKELQKEAIRAKRGPYQAYDDEEFEGDIGPGAKRKVGRQREFHYTRCLYYT